MYFITNQQADTGRKQSRWLPYSMVLCRIMLLYIWQYVLPGTWTSAKRLILQQRHFSYLQTMIHVGYNMNMGNKSLFLDVKSETYHCSRKKHDETSCQTKALVHTYGMDRHYRHVATLEINIPMHHPWLAPLFTKLGEQKTYITYNMLLHWLRMVTPFNIWHDNCRTFIYCDWGVLLLFYAATKWSYWYLSYRASGLGKQVVESLVGRGAFVLVRNNEAQSMS